MVFSSTLSEKSLELCTENLGNESGTDNYILEKCIFSSLSPPASPKTEHFASACHVAKRTVPMLGNVQPHNEGISSVRNFPPPLTTISGSSGPLSFWSHREDGRLIIEAVKVESTPSIFQAERSNGHLRLCLLNDDGFNSEENEDNDKLGLEEELSYYDEEDEIDVGLLSEGEAGEFLEVAGEMDPMFHQQSLISSNSRCKDVGECESKHNLLPWGVCINILI
ncbi:hypothetical protein ACFE04_015207 [Oxalis oulophora]